MRPGYKSVEKLLSAAKLRRSIGLERLIYSLGIRHVGETAVDFWPPIIIPMRRGGLP